MTKILGTAMDTGGSGINTMEISIMRTSDERYWSGTSWVDEARWLSVNGTTQWSYNASSVSWTSGKQYVIRSRAIDHATNIELVGVGNLFTFDIDNPSSIIDIPANNSFLNDLITISGTSLDIDGSGIDVVEICLRRNSDKRYWSGTDWLTKETWLLTTGTANWLYNTSFVLWTSNTIYSVQSRATDNAINIEHPNITVIFSVDQDKPSSTIDFPLDNSYLNNLNTISGYSSDQGGLGIQLIKISIMKVDDNNYWDGKKWSKDECWLLATGTDEWTFDASGVDWVSDSQYIIRSRAIDIAGNIEMHGSGITFIFDNQPPTDLSILINGDDEYTNSTAATLLLSAEDTGSGLALMSLSTDGNTWTSWEPFTGERSFTLPPLDGEKKVYFKVNDLGGKYCRTRV